MAPSTITSRLSRAPADFGQRLLLASLAGVTAAASMDLVRFSARRMGLIDRRVPEDAERWLAARATHPARRVTGADVALERVMHFGYGATAAAIYGAATRSTTLRGGVVLGVATWLFGSGVLLPALGITRPLWRARARENAVDLAAHLVYGLMTSMGMAELRPGPPDRLRAGRPAADRGTG